VSSALTAQQLGEIRVRDDSVQIFRDKFGGDWVGHKEGRLHGQHAIMDRRRLLKHLDDIAAVNVVAKDIAAMPITITASLRECGWVVEAPPLGGRTDPNRYLYIGAGENCVQWTVDCLEALRFAREADVRAFMSMSALSALLVRPTFKEWVTPC